MSLLWAHVLKLGLQHSQLWVLAGQKIARDSDGIGTHDLAVRIPERKLPRHRVVCLSVICVRSLRHYLGKFVIGREGRLKIQIWSTVTS